MEPSGNCQGHLPRARKGDKFKYLREPGRYGKYERQARDKIMGGREVWGKLESKRPPTGASLYSRYGLLVLLLDPCSLQGLRPPALALASTWNALSLGCLRSVISAQMRFPRRLPWSLPATSADPLVPHSGVFRALTSM